MSLLDDIDWVEIPAGTVQMGTPVAEIPALYERLRDLPVQRSWFLKECPRRAVHVDTFAISRVPLTVGQFNRLAAAFGYSPCEPGVPADHPVAVPYPLAERLADDLAGHTGQAVALPDEAQWERAARGDDAREYPWGDRFSPDRANLGEGGRGGTTPVGEYPRGASPFGILDLAGNLDEWTRSVYSPYPGAPVEVPATETWALDSHVTRGGGWNHQRDAGRCARRHGLYEPGPVGVRLVLGGVR